MPWVTAENGFETRLRCCFLFVESSTSLIYPKFFQCETLRLTLNVHYPRVFNGHQLWKYAIEINKISAWIVWDHKHFLTVSFCPVCSENTTEWPLYSQGSCEKNARLSGQKCSLR